MKVRKIAATILIGSALVLTAASCTSATAANSAGKSTLATVQKGSLSVSVTGTGNLAYSASQDLAFQVAGYVNEVLVKEGESVKKGQALAKLDTSEWEKQIKAREKALSTAQRNLTTKERALSKSQDQVAARENDIARAQRQVTTKENDIARAERQVAGKELAVRQAELDLQTVQNSLTQITDVKIAQDAIDAANFHIDFVEAVRKSQAGLVIADFTYWIDQERLAKQELATAQKALQEILNGTSTKVTSDVVLQVKKAQLQVEQSRRALEEARIAVDDAKNAVEDARLAKKDAEQAVKDAQIAKDDAELAVKNARMDKEDADLAVNDAQEDLDESKSLSPIITAPIDGFVPKINVKGGDEVFKGTVAMQLADPNQFEAVILVSEKNISSLKVGQSATITLDSLSGLTLPAQIIKIATMATTSQGVVNYQVTVKITSLQGTSRSAQTQTAAQPAARAPSAAAPRVSGGNVQRPAGVSGQVSTGTSSNTVAQSATLKSGLSAIVTIVVQRKDDVLKVPSRAITRQGQNSTVQVVTANGTETRIVKTGMSDNSNTEITEGLSEGEQVEIKASTASTATTGNAQPRGGTTLPGGIRLP